MNFSVFVFSLCPGLMLSVSIEIEEEIGIQIWQVHEGKEELDKIQFFGVFNFDTSGTYIVLEIKQKGSIYHYSLFYWVGTKSSVRQRQNSAEHVALFYHHLKQKNLRLLFFGREVEDYESENFSYLFGLDDRLKVPKLYRVQQSGEDAIISMFPVPCDRFFPSDVYVLNKGNEVSIWLGNLQYEKSWIAKLLAERIVKVDLQKKDVEAESCISIIDELLPKRNYYAKLYNFVREISDSKQRCSIDEKDTRILKNNTKQVELLRYSFDGESILKEKIQDTKLSLSKFQSNATYVLKNYVSRHTFIYLGKRAENVLIQRALAYAEVAFIGMERLSAWRKITIICEDKVAPTHFIIHFEDEINNLLPIPNESKLSIKWLHNTKQ